MKFTISWLKEHIETEAKLIDIINILETTGFPCANVQFVHDSWHKIKIAKIISSKPHPNADKLNLYTITLENQIITIVCGDKNLQIGDFVPFAAPGIVIPNGNFVLKIATIRGVESCGMLCSANELLLPIETKSGVLRCFESDYEKTIAEAYENEAFIEIEVTPNRGDMLSIRGIAKHLSYHGVGKLEPLQIKELKITNNDFFQIDTADCEGMACALIQHKICQTDDKIAKRLVLTGHNITNIDIVDLANYVSHEIGHPMHAFNYDKIAGKIIVNNLKTKEEFQPLIGEKILLNENTLVLRDNEKIISWPGIIGSNNSKIDVNTSKILLEAGIFKIDSVQRRKNKIQTIAAKKFEYGIDWKNLTIVLGRFLYLLNIDSIGFAYFITGKKKIIKFDLNLIKKILIQEMSISQLKSILEPRGFVLKELNNEIVIEVPSDKNYINTSNCIIEEIANYKELPALSLKKVTPISLKVDLKESLINTALFCGFFENYNFSITNKPQIYTESCIKILNANNANYSFLRTNMIESLLTTVQWHTNNNYTYRQFFEHGPIYYKYNEEYCQEEAFYAISNNYQDLSKLIYTFFAKNDFYKFDIAKSESKEWSNDAIEFLVKQEKIIRYGKINNEILTKFDLRNEEYFVLEILTDKLKLLEKKQHKFPSKNSPIYRDVCFTIPVNTPYQILAKVLQNYTFHIFDIYPPTADLSVTKNIGLRFVFEENRSLTSEQINEKINRIKNLVLNKLNITSS